MNAPTSPSPAYDRSLVLDTTEDEEVGQLIILLTEGTRGLSHLLPTQDGRCA